MILIYGVTVSVASLLSCLHQLRAENVRLEDHVSSLVQRRDHLLAVNARLAIPLTGQPAPNPHTGTKKFVLNKSLKKPHFRSDEIVSQKVTLLKCVAGL